MKNSNKIACIYANSLYDVFTSEDKKMKCLYDLHLLINVSDDNIKNFFTYPIVSTNEKKQLLDELIEFDKEVINLLKILLDDNNIILISDIYYEYSKILMAKNNIKIVNITITKKLDDKTFLKILNSLEEKLKSNIVLKMKIDTKIIGGICISYEQKIIDNSVKKNLDNILKSI